MKIVVDIGCCTWGQDSSVDRLIERFRPEVLYGFDPYFEVNDGTQELNGTRVQIYNQAAWVYDGEVDFVHDATRSHVPSIRTGEHDLVKCFDLAGWLMKMFILKTFRDELILKIDAEGAEHILIPDLTEKGAFMLIDLLLVEFHGDETRPPIPVPWEPWV